LKEAVIYLNTAAAESTFHSSQKYASNPECKTFKSTLYDLKQVMSGPSLVRSPDGRTDYINLPHLYFYPSSDLKEFAPIQFDYKTGRAVQWNASAYERILPSIKQDSDVVQTMDVISKSAVAGALSSPLSPF
jgi:hypothetical protein